MKKHGITKAVALYIEKVNAKELPEEVIEKAKDCLIDHLGSCFIGLSAKMSQITFGLVRGFFSSGNCPLIGTDFQSNVLGATWGNGVSGSAWDYDDGHRAPLWEGLSNEVLGHAAGHPGAVVIPSALSFGFHKRVSGISLLVSIIAGYEISLRLAASRKTKTVLANATGNWGVFAAAISAGKILGLKGEELENLFGIAASNLINPPKLPALRDMPMIKESIGWSGVTGSISAIMAQDGITGIRGVLDNEEFFDGTFFEDLGRKYHIMNVYFKPYSCCRMLHPAIDAAIMLKQKHRIDIEEIKAIIVETSIKAKELDNRHPRTIEEAQYSFPFCIASALKYGKVRPEVMSAMEFVDPVIVDLSKKTSLKLDEKQQKDSEVESLFPRKTAARVIIKTSEKKYDAYVECPKGDVGNPLTRIELIEKFKESSRRIVSDENSQQLIKFILNLNEYEKLEGLKPLLMAKPLT